MKLPVCLKRWSNEGKILVIFKRGAGTWQDLEEPLQFVLLNTTVQSFLGYLLCNSWGLAAVFSILFWMSELSWRASLTETDTSVCPSVSQEPASKADLANHPHTPDDISSKSRSGHEAADQRKHFQPRSPVAFALVVGGASTLWADWLMLTEGLNSNKDSWGCWEKSDFCLPRPNQPNRCRQRWSDFRQSRSHLSC